MNIDPNVPQSEETEVSAPEEETTETVDTPTEELTEAPAEA